VSSLAEQASHHSSTLDGVIHFTHRINIIFIYYGNVQHRQLRP
jgi:hypothetical protein